MSTEILSKQDMKPQVEKSFVPSSHAFPFTLLVLVQRATNKHSQYFIVTLECGQVQRRVTVFVCGKREISATLDEKFNHSRVTQIRGQCDCAIAPVVDGVAISPAVKQYLDYIGMTRRFRSAFFFQTKQFYNLFKLNGSGWMVKKTYNRPLFR